MIKMKKIIRGLITVILGLILAMDLYILAVQIFAGEAVPGIFGFHAEVAVSGSMEPLFSPGDLLIYREESTYQAGEVILFRQEDSLITHRIVEEQNDQFKTKGDANNVEDEGLTNTTQIEGKLILVIPAIGKAVLFFKTPLGMLVLIASGLLLIWTPHIRSRDL